MKHLLILIFILVFIFFGHELGYNASSPWWTHITYNFQHADWLHLIFNSVSFFYIFRALERFIRPRLIITVSLLAAFTASLFCIYDVPTVGASGMVYAMVGMYFALVSAKRVRYKDKTRLYIFIACVALFLTVSFIKQNSAGMLHLLSLIFGFSEEILIIYFKKKQHGYTKHLRS